MFEHTAIQTISNQAGKIKMTASCNGYGETKISINTDNSSMEHYVTLDFYKYDDDKISKHHRIAVTNPDLIELTLAKESDAMFFLDSLEDLIYQAKQALYK